MPTCIFHTLIYAGAHNEALQEFTATLRRRLAPFRRAQFRTAGRLPRSHAEHDAVVKAILAGDAGRGAYGDAAPCEPRRGRLRPVFGF